MREMVDCMYEKIYTEGQLVIQEGEPGNYLYVLAGQRSTTCVALMGLLLSHLKLEKLRDLGDVLRFCTFLCRSWLEGSWPYSK